MLKETIIAVGVAALASASVLPSAVSASGIDAPLVIASGCNPCNPCAAKKGCNPCNPCAAKKACSPCNPCAAKGCSPCNPCNPCNPCKAD